MSAEHVRIEPIAAQYRAGDSVWVNVRNIGEVDVAFNLCRASRERLEAGTGWVSSAVLDRNCPDALALLRVGTTARIFVEVVPVGVSTGLYRYTFTGLQIDGAVLPKSERESASFRVRE